MALSLSSSSSLLLLLRLFLRDRRFPYILQVLLPRWHGHTEGGGHPGRSAAPGEIRWAVLATRRRSATRTRAWEPQRRAYSSLSSSLVAVTPQVSHQAWSWRWWSLLSSSWRDVLSAAGKAVQAQAQAGAVANPSETGSAPRRRCRCGAAPTAPPPPPMGLGRPARVDPRAGPHLQTSGWLRWNRLGQGCPCCWAEASRR